MTPNYDPNSTSTQNVLAGQLLEMNWFAKYYNDNAIANWNLANANAKLNNAPAPAVPMLVIVSPDGSTLVPWHTYVPTVAVSVPIDPACPVGNSINGSSVLFSATTMGQNYKDGETYTDARGVFTYHHSNPWESYFLLVPSLIAS